ncbi:hypothetical protein HAX54_005474, partial [Datura stramonium]|nr:hypothetical protein [Datura stramonium]
ASEILDKFAKTNKAWYSIESETAAVKHLRGVPAELQKRGKERDQDMAQIKAQMKLITTHLTTMSTQRCLNQTPGDTITGINVGTITTMIVQAMLVESK